MKQLCWAEDGGEKVEAEERKDMGGFFRDPTRTLAGPIGS